MQIAKSCEYREGTFERALSIKSIEESREELAHIETRSKEFIGDSPLVRVPRDDYL